MISGVTAEDFVQVYDHLSGYFDSFVERSGGATQPGELERKIITGEMQCAVAIKGNSIVGCSLSKIEIPARIVVTHCAGERADEWGESLLDYYEEWADAVSDGKLAIVCRPGWVKLLGDRMKPSMYKETHKIMERV